MRGILGGKIAKKLEVPVTEELLHRIAKCMVDIFVKEAKKDFAKRGWSGEASDGSAPIWDSFSYNIRGEKTIEILSSYPYIDEMTTRNVPRHRMTWLTQEAKERNPSHFPLTPRETRLRMKRGGRVSKGERLPLVVPLKSSGGTVIFRTAPLRTQDAWIHPGIARFTFVERAARAGKKKCIEIMQEEAVRAVIGALGE